MGTPFPSFDNTDHIKFFEDFFGYEADQWIKTETGSGTQAVLDERGGVLKLTNAAADNDHNFLQWSGDDDTGTCENFKWQSGKRFYFAARFKVLEVIQSDFIMGLQITDTTPLAATDGIFFQCDDGDALLDFHVGKNSTYTDVTGIHTMVADTYVKVAFYYDGASSQIDIYIDDVKVGKAAITNVVDDEELTISFGCQNGEGVANSISVDYVLVVQER